MYKKYILKIFCNSGNILSFTFFVREGNNLLESVFKNYKKSIEMCLELKFKDLLQFNTFITSTQKLKIEELSI